MKSRRILIVVVAALALTVVVPVAASAHPSAAPRPHVIGLWPNDVNFGGGGGYAVWNTGKVQALNGAPNYGSVTPPVTNIVGFAPDPDSGGYWLIGANGQVYAEGTTCQDETLVGPKVKPTSGVVGAIYERDDTNEGFTMVTALGGLYSYTCEFTY
jgi:hypothetical protein